MEQVIGIRQSFRTLLVLLQRDQKDLLPSLFDSIINSTILFVFQGVQFLFLYPVLGMSQQMAASVFMGTFVFLFIEVAFTKSLALVYDLRFGRFIEYFMILPLHRNWVLSFYVLSAVIRMICNTLPMFLLAKLLLGNTFNIAGIHWIGLVSIYLLSMVFCALLFFSVAFLANFDWYMNSLWQQVLMPMQIFGGIFFTWSSIATSFPVLHALMRINPYTYMLEGLRLSVLDFYQSSLSIGTCIIAMIIACAVGCLVLSEAAKRRLDMI